MSKMWNGTGFFQMMADNEKAVGDLYRQMSKSAVFGGKFFENLAKDEDRHHEIYKALLHKYENNKGLEISVSDEQEAYLKLLIQNNMLKDADKLIEKVKKFTIKDDAFAVAERAERDSVMFVQELIELYPELQPEDFKVILQEEKAHLSMVMQRRMDSQLDNLKM